MSYTFNRFIAGATIDEIDARTRTALTAKGFGVLTEIDVQATMKKKLDVDMPPYRILGACNPRMAYKAIGIEPRVGAMLPCNVILRAMDGGVEVSAIDPVASMVAIDNAALKAVAGQVRGLASLSRRGDLTLFPAFVGAAEPQRAAVRGQSKHAFGLCRRKLWPRRAARTASTIRDHQCFVETRREAQMQHYRINDPRVGRLLAAFYDVYCADAEAGSGA